MKQYDSDLYDALKHFGCGYLKIEYRDGVFETGNIETLPWNGQLRKRL